MTTNSDSFLVTRSDVLVEAIEPPECSDCVDRATKRVLVELRGIGQSVHIGDFCNDCAAVVAEGLRRSLPPSPDEVIP